jgi:hypothetical protein
MQFAFIKFHNGTIHKMELLIHIPRFIIEINFKKLVRFCGDAAAYWGKKLVKGVK